MGFTPDHFIDQDYADIVDINNNQRISWNLDETNGGWRLGSLINLDTGYYKVIITKDL